MRVTLVGRQSHDQQLGLYLFSRELRKPPRIAENVRGMVRVDPTF